MRYLILGTLGGFVQRVKFQAHCNVVVLFLSAGSMGREWEREWPWDKTSMVSFEGIPFSFPTPGMVPYWAPANFVSWLKFHVSSNRCPRKGASQQHLLECRLVDDKHRNIGVLFKFCLEIIRSLDCLYAPFTRENYRFCLKGHLETPFSFRRRLYCWTWFLCTFMLVGRHLCARVQGNNDHIIRDASKVRQARVVEP